jgi:hypothetical protein
MKMSEKLWGKSGLNIGKKLNYRENGVAFLGIGLSADS